MWFLLVFEEKSERVCEEKSGFQAERARRRTQLSVEEQNYRENALQQSKSGAFIVLDDQILLLLLPFLLSATGCSSSATKTITSSGAIKHTTSTHKHSREDRGGTVIVSVWRKWTQNRNNPAVTSWRSSSYRRSCQNTHTRCTSGVCVCGGGGEDWKV